MTIKRPNHKNTDICANCESATQAWDNLTEAVVCTNENAEHCGHILTYDHYTCIFYKARNFCECHKRN